MLLMYYDGLYLVPNKGHVTKGVLMRKAEIEAEMVNVTLQWMEKGGVRLNTDRRKVILETGIRDFLVSEENTLCSGKYLDKTYNYYYCCYYTTTSATTTTNTTTGAAITTTATTAAAAATTTTTTTGATTTTTTTTTISAPVQNKCRAHPSYCTMSTGFLPGV
jgi:hypothetical protein